MPEPFTPTLAKSASLATLAGTTHTRKSVSFVQSSTARKARHPNQLDLFADTPIDRASAADSLTAPALATEHPDGRQYPPRADDSQPLAEAPAADGRGADPKESAVAGVAPGPGADGRSPLRTHLGEKDGLPGGVGTGDGRMGAARDRSPPEGAILCEPEPEPTLFPSRDFRITDAHRIGKGGLHEKARDNIAAIRLLKKLEGENRDATDTEKTVLARYVGWGALSAVFDRWSPGEWKDTAKDLEDLLTCQEYESAQASTPNAHFTSPVVIEGIWNGLRRLGLPKHSAILEPSMGIGHFLGLQPDELLPSHRTGVELDSVTARIARQALSRFDHLRERLRGDAASRQLLRCRRGQCPVWQLRRPRPVLQAQSHPRYTRLFLRQVPGQAAAWRQSWR
jgi:hypothetical protein